MTPHEPPRLALALLDRFLPGNEPLTGDLLEESRHRSRAWLWQQVIMAVLQRTAAEVGHHKRMRAEALLVGAAMLALLGFHAVVGATLINRVLLMGDPQAVSAAGRYEGWHLLAATASFFVAAAIGRAIGRVHRTHRLGAVLLFSGSAVTAAFVNLYYFVPGAALRQAILPPDAGTQIVASMLFIGGLLIGIGSISARDGSLRIALGALLAAAALQPDAHAQSPADVPTFDVASIRRNVTSDQQGSGLSAPQPGGRYIALGVTLRRLVGDAYGAAQIVGGPAWADSDRFDVNAVASGEPTPAEIQRRLRALLAERFRLKVHTEPREMPVYLLRPARSPLRLGPGLRQSDAKCAAEAANYFPRAARGSPPPCGDFRMSANALIARGMTMEGLAARLSGRVGRPVIDRTGLAGAFDLELQWTSDGGLAPVPRDSAGIGDLRADGVSLFTALQEQLGFRLEAARAPVDVLVIDSAEPPTPD